MPRQQSKWRLKSRQVYIVSGNLSLFCVSLGLALTSFAGYSRYSRYSLVSQILFQGPGKLNSVNRTVCAKLWAKDRVSQKYVSPITILTSKQLHYGCTQQHPTDDSYYKGHPTNLSNFSSFLLVMLQSVCAKLTGCICKD